MPKLFVSELKEGMPVESVFLCAFKALLKDKNGKPYANLKLMDRSGVVEARIWEKANHLIGTFAKLDYVWVKGNVVSFQNRLQFNVADIREVEPQEVNPHDFLPHTSFDIPEMYEALRKICREDLKNPWVRRLVLSIIEDPEYGPAFQKSPAAKSNHHAWIGGLLEHVLKLCRVGKDVLKHYPEVNGDLVLAGLILHDFGKIQELTTERYIEYSDQGQLVGHLAISLEILIRKSALLEGFPKKILQHLQHIILAHHGKLEYGSPKEPMTLEALLVHHLDHMDSKLQGFLDVIHREAEGNDAWSAPGIVFRYPIYKRSLQDMQESEPAEPTPEPPAKAKAPPSPNASNPAPASTGSSERKKNSTSPLKTNLGELLSRQIKQRMD